MWALRRASHPLRRQSNCIVVARACGAHLNISSGFADKGSKNESINCASRNKVVSDSCCHESPIFPNSFFWTRNLSSGSGTKSNGLEDEHEEVFSDIEADPENIKSADTVAKDNDDISIEGDVSEEEIEETVESELGLSDDENEPNGEKKTARKSKDSPLFKLLMETPRQSVSEALSKWVNEGNLLGRDEISLAVLHCRKLRQHAKALQLYEWLDKNKHLEFNVRDYVSYLDLIAKVQGIPKAEQYINNNIPEPSRTEHIYRTILANCVATDNIKKSEEIFKKIRSLPSPLTTFSCNQLLLLYKRVDCKKVPILLKTMEAENVKPSLLTYRLLIDMKGRSHDISGMEELIQMMISENIEPDVSTKSVAAMHYIHAGQNEKAESILKEIEGKDVNEHRYACKKLLSLYSALGKKDDVERIWKICEPNPGTSEGLACINAWGKLGNVEKAEKVFESMEKMRNKLSPRYYDCMIKMYADHKLVSKGRRMAEKMAEKWKVGPSTWDALVKLYVECGEVEKADLLIQKAVKKKKMKPLYNTYVLLLEHYARRGDVHNAEKIFQSSRENGYVGRMGMYCKLLKAYQNARTPIYGFRERMKADNLYPGDAVAAQLAALDALKNTQISDLLD